MSGCFEVAAGAFAVIGVADVTIRSGREVYGLLRDIADAPYEIERLCSVTKEITLLAETSRGFLDAFDKRKPSDATFQMIALLDTSLKSFNRELHSLRVLSAKFRGGNKNWGRVRYVLDERKISKAFENLERSKGLLGDALAMACRQRSDEHHRENLQRHDTNRNLLKSSRRTQAKVLARQTSLAHTSTCILRRTAQVSNVVTKSHQENISEHQKTRVVLSAKLEDIISAEMAKLRTTVAISMFDREVFFFGQRRDMIMAYLLLVKPQLAVVVQHLLSRDNGDLRERHIAWLQSEFDNLMASAAQEEASRYSRSTATPLDQWYYSEEIVRHQERLAEPKIEHSTSTNGTTRVTTKPLTKFASSQASNCTQETFAHSTTFGSLRVQVPRRNSRLKANRLIDDVGLTFTCGIGESTHVINARFYRNVTQAAGPKLCAQLNVFTIVECEAHYDDLFAHATAEGIDNALRRGLISPYHINREGRNLCLYYAAEHTRTDLLDYLDSQGIGVASLNHDLSLVAGLFVRSIVDSDRATLEASVDHIFRQVHDSSGFLFETTMNMLLWDYYKKRPRSLLQAQLVRLQTEGLISHIPASNDDLWNWASVSSIITPLFESTTYVDTTGSLGRNRIQRCYASVLVCNGGPGDPTTVEEIANALIKAGVNVHHRDHDGLTPSMYARRAKCWEGWCRALLRNGTCIVDVLREEEAEWLAEEGWQEIWEKKYGKLS